MTRETLRELLSYTEWADAVVWSAVPLSAPQDERLFALLTHAHSVQHAFLTVWTGGDLNALFERQKQIKGLVEVQALAREFHPRARAFLDTVAPDRLSAPLQVPWAGQIAEYLGRTPGPTTVSETIFQVVSHSTYHRGQVNAQLRSLGFEPPNVDYIAWLWVDRPAAEWPA